MNNNRNYSQKGGLGFDDAIKADLLSLSLSRSKKNRKITDIDIIRLLLSDVNECSILSDGSTYSFVLKLQMKKYRLVDTYDKPLLDTIDMPGLGNKGKKLGVFCCKLCFVSKPPLSLDQYPKTNPGGDRTVTKYSVLPVKAIQEGNIQDKLLKLYSCKNSRSSFVPDVIAQHILSYEQFKEMFARILIPSYMLTDDMPSFSEFPEVEHNTRENSPGVMGSREGIYDYITAQFTKGISVHVILMEMMSFVSEEKIFKPLRQLTHNAQQSSSVRVAAQIVLVETEGIAPHDIHGDNAFGLTDGSRTCIIDWGGILYMNDKNDVDKLVACLIYMCHDERYMIRTVDQNTQQSLEINAKEKTENLTEHDRLMIIKPSLEELCLFLEVDMTELPKITTEKAYRKELEKKLVEKFITVIQECFVHFGEEGPTMENVHFRLSVFAFIDFLYNRIALNHPYCQSRQILEYVYPVGSIFTDFRSFLNGFKLRTLPSQNNVATVVANIKWHLEPCPSGAKIDPSQLKPDWQKLIKESESKPRRGSLSKVSKASSKHSRLGKSSNGHDGDDGDIMDEPTPSRDSRRDPILVPSKPPVSVFARLASRITNSKVNPKNWGWTTKRGGKHKHKRRHNCKTKRKIKFV